MSQIVNTVKLYKEPVRILAFQRNSGVRNNNLSLDDTDFRAFKGLTSNVEFLVRDNDRKPINLIGKRLFVNVHNRRNGEFLLQKDLEVIDFKRSKAQLTILPNEILNWKPGYYSYSIIVENEDTTQNTLFLDQNQGPIGTLELVDGVMPPILQSITLTPDKFTSAGILFGVTQHDPDTYISSALPGANEKGFESGLHTFALFANNFKGKLWIQGTLEREPSTEIVEPNTDWFNVEVEGNGLPLEFKGFTGVEAYNFFANINWVRFMYQPDPLNEGSLTKIQYVP